MNMRPAQTGFTVIEVLVVVGIFGILAAIGLIFSMDFFRTYGASSELNNAVSVLSKARARSLANIHEHQHGVCVDAANQTYILFQGDGPDLDYSSRLPDLDEAVPSGSSPATCPNEIVFSQLSGNTNCLTDCVVSLNNYSIAKEVRVNSQGAILW